MTNKAQRTIVVLRAPGRQLVCLRMADLPVPLAVSQVFDFDGVLFQQVNTPVVCLARNSDGTIIGTNKLLMGVLKRVYGEAEMLFNFSHGALNYSEDDCTVSKISAGGIVVDPYSLLKESGDNIVLVNCRIVSDQYVGESFSSKGATGKGAGNGAIGGIIKLGAIGGPLDEELASATKAVRGSGSSRGKGKVKDKSGSDKD